jgi:hypothetical protein
MTNDSRLSDTLSPISVAAIDFQCVLKKLDQANADERALFPGLTARVNGCSSEMSSILGFLAQMSEVPNCESLSGDNCHL